MNEFIIHFVGIVMFVANSGTGPTDKRVAVVPSHFSSSMHQGKHVHPHVAYLAFPLEGTTVSWGNEPPKTYRRRPGWGYFELDKYNIVVDADAPKLDVKDSHSNSELIPKIKDYCPSFEYSAAKPVAAVVPISVGELSGHSDGDVGYSDWKVRVPGSLTIRAFPRGGGDPRFITLPRGAEAIIGNQTVEWINESRDPNDHYHYYIYYKLDANQNTCKRRPADRDSDMDCSNTNYP
jgi:hypothetical protein